MIKIITNLFIFLFVSFFSYYIFYQYNTEKNKNEIKQNRSNYKNSINNKIINLDYLKNDTNNVIEFNSGYKIINKNKIKRNFWELLNIK